MKCDEARPSCSGCVSTGRNCEGYSDDSKAASKALIFLPPNTIAKSLSNTHNPVNVEEAQYLNHFRHLLIRGMSGFVISPLWEKLILQAIHDEPAVCHAAVAFSALQLSNYSSKPLSKTNLQVFALHQYATSVRAFNNLLLRRSLRSIEASLMCSIICICFELLEGSPILAQRHLENGLQVVSSFDGMLNSTFEYFNAKSSANEQSISIFLAPLPVLMFRLLLISMEELLSLH